MTIYWKAVEKYFTVLLCFFNCYPVCNFGKIIKFGLCTVRSERVKGKCKCEARVESPEGEEANPRKFHGSGTIIFGNKTFFQNMKYQNSQTNPRIWVDSMCLVFLCRKIVTCIRFSKRKMKKWLVVVKGFCPSWLEWSMQGVGSVCPIWQL